MPLRLADYASILVKFYQAVAAFHPLGSIYALLTYLPCVLNCNGYIVE